MYLYEIYVTNASLNINRPFTYYSDVLYQRFIRVKVMFNNSFNMGFISDVKQTNQTINEYDRINGYKTLPIIEAIDNEPFITEEIYRLAQWLSKTTVSPFISCLNTMLPKALKATKKQTNIKMLSYFKKINGDFILTKKQKEIYDSLYDGILASEARKMSVSIINKLLSMNAIQEYRQEASFTNTLITNEPFKVLTNEQKSVYESLINTDKHVSLLFGVTGSGKTEVYLHLAKHYLSLNKEVLILVPEISLTPQMIQRVKERFNDVVFYHSELSDQERYEQYQRIKNSEVKIVVGTRSAIFLPFHNLGLIIIDEEHDTSYKQDNTPMYHAKNVAIKRALDHSAKVLLASATPSMDSFSRGLKGEYQLLELKNRINNMLPDIEVIDLVSQIKKRDSYIISKPLKDELDICLANNKQAIILLNRRGYSPVVKCGDCGTTLTCKDCDVPLSYHQDQHVLKCHQCSRTYPVSKICPKCGSKNLIFYGFGTKKVEEQLKLMYPNLCIERMDRDSVMKKGSHERILSRFGNREIDILIGTQMIAKGLDYPDVTLVGILNADAGLMHQDYNSAKLTFDLLMQASGRSGRASQKGKVIIQAFNPDHYAIKAVVNQDYRYFYNIEMNYRSKTNYPPYAHIFEILLSDTNYYRLEYSLDVMNNLLKDLPYKKYHPLELTKIKGQKRYRILLTDKDIVALLNDIIKVTNEYLNTPKVSHIKIDIDPLYIE